MGRGGERTGRRLGRQERDGDEAGPGRGSAFRSSATIAGATIFAALGLLAGVLPAASASARASTTGQAPAFPTSASGPQAKGRASLSARRSKRTDATAFGSAAGAGRTSVATSETLGADSSTLSRPQAPKAGEAHTRPALTAGNHLLDHLARTVQGALTKGSSPADGRQAGPASVHERPSQVTPTPVPSCPSSADVWTGEAGTAAWQTASNWSNGVPGSSSYACVTATGASVTVSSAPTVAGLLLGSGDDLSVLSGTLTLSGSATPSALQGGLTVEAGAALDVDSGALLLDATGAAVTIEPASNGLAAGALAVLGAFEQDAGTVATAAGDAPVELENGSALTFAGDGPGDFEVYDPSDIDDTVTLAGDLAAGQSLEVATYGSGGTAGTTTVDAAASFTNDGTIAVAQVSGQGNFGFDLAAGATLTNTGSFELSGPATGEFIYTDDLSGAFVNDGGTFDVGGAEPAELTLTDGSSLTNEGGLTIGSGSALSVAAGASVDNGTGGSITNENAFSSDADAPGVLVHGAFTEDAGTVATAAGDGPVELENGSALTFAGDGPGDFEVYDPSDIDDTVTLAGDLAAGQSLEVATYGSGGTAGTTTVDAAASFTNDGTIAVAQVSGQGNFGFDLAAGATLTNTGSFELSGPATGEFIYTDDLSGAFVNDGGTFDVGGAEPAELTLTDGSSLTNEGGLTIGSGSALSVAAGASVDNGTGGSITNENANVLDLSSNIPGLVVNGSFTEGAGTVATGSGDGPVYLMSGSTDDFDGDGPGGFVVPPGADVSVSGDIAVGQSLTIELDRSTCGGTIVQSDSGLTNAGTITLFSEPCGGSPAELSAAGTIVNTGTIAFTGTGGSQEIASPLDNEASGTISVADASTATVDGTTTNDGTITISSGELDLSGGLANLDTATGTLTGGAYQVLGTSGAGGTATLALEEPGIDHLAASVELGAAGVIGTSDDSTFGDLTTIDSAGSLALDSAVSLAVGSPTLTNSGTISLAAGDELTTGAYTQTASGTLAVGIDGEPSSGELGTLAAAGAIALSGTLAIETANDLTPEDGDSYAPLSAASLSGRFQLVTGSSLGGGLAYTTEYGQSKVELVVGEASQLVAQSVSGPAGDSAAVGQSITASWTVQAPDGAVTGSWEDAVYLSPSTAAVAGAVLLGTVTHNGGLGAAQSYQASLQATLPGVLPGGYELVVVVDAADQTAQADRAEDVASTPLQVAMQSLTVGAAAVSGSIPASGDVYYELSPSAGSTLQLDAAFASSASASLFEAFARVPSPQDYDLAASDPSAANQSLTVTNTQSAGYFVDLDNPTSAPVSFSLAASAPSLAVSSASPSSAAFLVVPDAPNLGLSEPDLVETIDGAGFTPSSTVTLDCASSVEPEIPASSVTYVSPSELYADFGEAPQPESGNGSTCAVSVADGAASAQLAGALHVFVTAVAPVENYESQTFSEPVAPGLSLSAPSINRPGVDSVVTVNYWDPYDYEIPAPLLQLTADGATLHYTNQPAGDGSTLWLLGVAPSGDPGVLQPGQSGSIDVVFDSTLEAHQTVSFELDPITDPGSSVYIGQVLASLLPANAPNAVVDYIYGEGGPDGYTTAWQLQAGLDEYASYLGSLGEANLYDADELGYELNQLDDYGAMVTDYTEGPFGYGLPGLVDTLSVDKDGNVTVTDPLGDSTVFARTPAGSYAAPPGVLSTLDALAPSGSLTGFVMTETDGSSDTFDYDPGTGSGQLVTTSDGYGNVSTYSYDANGQLTAMHEPNGDVISYAYEAGLVASASDAASGQVVDYGYDAAGHLVSMTTNGRTETLSWDESNAGEPTGNTLASMTAPDGVTTSFSYDSSGRLTEVEQAGVSLQQLSYNTDGSFGVTDADGDTTTEYPDATGAVVREVLPNGELEESSTDDLGEVTAASVGTSTSSFGYDSSGDLTSVTNPLGQTATLSWAGPGQLTSYAEPSGDTTSFGLNSQGDPSTIGYPDGTTESIAYSEAGSASPPPGLITSVTDRAGNQIGLSYDPDGDLTDESLPDGEIVSFGYDQAGDLTSATNSSGTTSYDYNGDDELTRVTYPTGLSVAYTYNQAGQETSVTTSDGYELDYAYNSAGRLASVADGSGHTLVSYSYTPGGELAGIANANGTGTSYTYDALGDIASVTDSGPGGPSSTYTYTRNGVGEATSVTGPDGATSYSYDAAGELTSASLPGGRTITYHYDADGNFTAVVDSSAGTTSYGVNDDDEYTSADNTTSGDATYTYDPDGNLASVQDSAGTTTYTWNALGQLSEVSGPSGTTRYTYDALGTPLSETVDGTTTDLLADPAAGGALIGEYSGSGSALQHYVIGAGLAGLSDSSGNTSYYGFDGSGDVVSISDPSGSVTDSYDYLPYGALASSSGSTANPFMFGGQLGLREDSSTGLVADGVRFYDPATGRFVSQDPTLLSGPNPYQFAGNDPIDNTDLTGHAATSDETAIETVVNDAIQAAIDTTTAAAGVASSFGQSSFGSLNNNNPAENSLTTLSTVNSAAGLASANFATSNGLTEAVWNEAGTGFNIEPEGAQWFNKVGNGLTVANGLTNLYSDFNGMINNPPAAPLATMKQQANTMIDAINIPLELAAADIPFSGQIIEGTEHVIDKGSNALFNWWFGVPPNASFSPKVNGSSATRTSTDPNELVGPAGYGAAGYVQGGTPLPYEIDFTNEASASASAQTVRVTDQLDPSLDLSTFSLGSFGFADLTVTPPPGMRSYSATIDDIAESGLDVEVQAALDSVTRTVTWSFTSIDPATGLPPTSGAGFLPPDADPPGGEGFVSYTVAPLASATTGTTVSADASVVFDANPPIETATVTNTIDASIPDASIDTLPASTTSPFTVSWSGTDDPDSSGIATYDVWVSHDGGAYTPLETATAATSTSFDGQVGGSYSFIATATSNTGNSQLMPSSGQAETTVVAGSSPGSSGGSSPPASPVTGSPPSTAPPAGASARPARAALRLRSTRLVVKRSRLPLVLACTGGTCQGSLRLDERVVSSVRHHGRVTRSVRLVALGSLRLDLAPGRQVEVRLRPNARGRAILARASRRHPLHLEVVVVLSSVTRSIRVVVT